MNSLEIRNRKIIDAVIRKEQAVCPGAIALIGIYGSFQTGDIHPLSDLDLLILINDDRGWQLGKAFIQEDLGVGHDIYCTTRESLRQDAEYDHPHISKLMDAQIVYCADEKYRIELETLREQVRKKLAEPFGEEDYRKAEKELKEARCCYADAMTAEALNDARRSAGGVIFFAENALALLNKTYFCKGVSRRREELDAMERKPDHLCGMIENVLAATTVEELKEQVEAAEKKAAEAEAKAAETEAKMAEADAKEAERKNEFLRLMAEFDTFRRRTAEEKLELVKSASADTIKGLLPVLDDCEIALSQLEKTEGNEAAVEGVQLIFNKLMGYLKTKGLERIEAKGEVFDTELHEAVTLFPAPSEDLKGKVIDVAQTGYTLGGKVLRFAKVIVGA